MVTYEEPKPKVEPKQLESSIATEMSLDDSSEDIIDTKLA